ncbi:cytochrome d ubiquinol oxidase subunit II [Mycobacterium sp. djl-10]|nr:cytochrome d ubiquinol oxidase subunit II [Mycobacterium sp. djl-10]
MGLQEIWFLLVGMLFLGFFVLEGFDFGVGMLMEPLARLSKNPEMVDKRRRAVLNTIGPVWDGNEVWLITAGGAMFAAFPGWYATVFSGLFLPLLAILLSMIVRVVAIEWRGKIDDPTWRRRADLGIAIGSWVPAILWGVAFASLVQGLPVDADAQIHLTFSALLNPYTLAGGLATGGLFLLHGAAFLALKTEGEIRADALRAARLLAWPVTAVVACFGIWTQLGYGKSWTWAVLALAVAAQLVAVALLHKGTRDGWAFISTTLVVVGVIVLAFGALFPNLVPSTLNPDWSLTITNASSTPYTLTVMTWAAAIFAPLVIIYQAWTYWVFRQRISTERIPDPIGLGHTH